MKKLLTIFSIALLIFSCEEFSDGIYSGPDQIAFARTSAVGLYLEEPTAGDDDLDSLEIQLIGAQSSSDITFDFELDATNEAVEGVHIDFVTTGGTGTIPANSSVGYIYFRVISDNFSPSDEIDLVINLTGSSVSVAGNFTQMSKSLSITCESDIAGDYNFTSTGLADPNFDGVQTPYSVTGTVTVTAGAGVGQYSVDDMSFGCYPQVYFDTPPSGGFTDICATITGDGDVDQYNDPFTINATVNGDGSIDLTWSNTFGDTGTVTLTPTP